MQQRPILPVITLPLWLEYHHNIMTWKVIRPGGRRSLAMLARKRMESITTQQSRAVLKPT
jgi:hypothetical protein